MDDIVRRAIDGILRDLRIPQEYEYTVVEVLERKLDDLDTLAELERELCEEEK